MMIEQHDRYLADIQEENEDRISRAESEIKRMQDEAEEQGQLLITATTMVEEDCDTEIVQLKIHFDKRLEREKEILLQLKGDNGLIKKRNTMLHKKYDEQEARIRAVNEKAQDMENKLEVAKRDIVALKKETKERDETIGDKEKRIYELKKKNQELEKFKFVLDYKIKELRKQIEPKELEIAGMKETVTEMDAELDRYNKINQALELDNVSMQSKLEATQKHALRQRQEHVESVNLNNRFQGDLEETVQYIQDYKMLKASVKLLYQRHCGQVQNKASVNDELNKELFRQREYLEKSVDNLKKKLVKDSNQATYQSRRHMNDNSLLIKEINDLRREIKNLKAANGRIVADMNFKALGSSPAKPAKPQRPQSAAVSRMGVSSGGRVRPGDTNDEVEMLHNEIFRLRQYVAELEEQNGVDRPSENNPGNAWLETGAS